MPLDPNADPTILHVNDILDPFAPGPRDRLMLNLKEDRERIEALLDKLLAIYNLDSRKNLPIQICTGAAMAAAKELLADRGGKVLVFATNYCSKGVGKLKSRDDPKHYNTPEEKKIFAHTAEHNFFGLIGTQALK